MSNRFNETSSGDVTLHFTNGDVWIMPDMILHYTADHGWLPPGEFVADVMSGTLSSGSRVQTRGGVTPRMVGYLRGSCEKGTVPAGFVDQLERLMKQAGGDGNRKQTKKFVYRE